MPNDIELARSAKLSPIAQIAQRAGLKRSELIPYGALAVKYSPKAESALADAEKNGFGSLPVCVAKTQYSFSDDPTLLGRPRGFTLHISDAYVSAGAGFVVVQTGKILTMPGLPALPAACGMDIDEKGRISGLF